MNTAQYKSTPATAASFAPVSAAGMEMARPLTAEKKSVRIPALDFTKGVLVLVMVFYHWLNYFVGPEGFFYVYLRFLPPSFICITGFFVSQIYLTKYGVSDVRLSRRLAVRGAKILGIFVLLNIAIGAVGRGTGQMLNNFTPEALKSIYLTGNMTGGRLVAFYVLVPIAYVLLLSAILLIVCGRNQRIFQVVCGVLPLAVLVFDLVGYKSANLELLAIGMLGISIGFVPMSEINRLLRHPLAIVLTYCAYLAAISAWDVRYPMLIVGVVLTLLLIYLIGSLSGDSGMLPRAMILLGKYSLVGYIAQIAILQILRRSLSYNNLSAWALLASFVAAMVLTFAVVFIVDRARTKAPMVNQMYAAVFS
jgi:peptidoglycan/LPS O-acetylase OafA/YrhL